MSRNTIPQLNTRLDSEFLLIFTKMKSIEKKLDLIFSKLNPNPEELLSTSEINMMKSWRTQAESRSNESDNTPTGE